MKYKILIDIQHQAMDFVEQDEPQPNNTQEFKITSVQKP